MGLAPATSGVTGRCSTSLSYGGSVRALGLEPSLFRGKSPVPYQSGVTRMGSAARHARPIRVPGPRDDGPGNDASAVVKVLVPGLVIRSGTLGRSRTSCLRVWRPRRRRDSSACGRCGRAHDGERALRRDAACELERESCAYQRCPGLPTRSALPSRHACAPRLDRVRTRSVGSTVIMRAIGRDRMPERDANVNRIFLAHAAFASARHSEGSTPRCIARAVWCP